LEEIKKYILTLILKTIFIEIIVMTI